MRHGLASPCGDFPVAVASQSGLVSGRCSSSQRYFFFKLFISFKPQILKAGPDGTDRIKTGKTGTQATVSGCIRVLSLDIKECTEYVSAFLM